MSWAPSPPLDSEKHPQATDLLVAYELDPAPGEKVTYASLAQRFEMTVSEVTSNLRWGRRHFRALLEEEIWTGGKGE